MSFSPDSLQILRDATFDTVIDVRAPSEFAEDHVPGAINLPVLSDAERARVGTILQWFAHRIGRLRRPVPLSPTQRQIGAKTIWSRTRQR